MNQSSGGCSQKSFLLESYDLSSSVRAPDANSNPATATAAAAVTIVAAPGFHFAERLIFSPLDRSSVWPALCGPTAAGSRGRHLRLAATYAVGIGPRSPLSAARGHEPGFK